MADSHCINFEAYTVRYGSKISFYFFSRVVFKYLFFLYAINFNMSRSY